MSYCQLSLLFVCVLLLLRAAVFASPPSPGDGQWGVGHMQHDLSDAVQWAIKSGIADPQRVCIMGASYGGYATFAGEEGVESRYCQPMATTCSVHVQQSINIPM